jgi:hypothetical protein
VAFGYLSILLGNLCRNDDIRQRVRSALPNQALTPLISSIEEFLWYHKTVDRALQSDDDGFGPDRVLTVRLQAVVDRLKDSEARL